MITQTKQNGSAILLTTILFLGAGCTSSTEVVKPFSGAPPSAEDISTSTEDVSTMADDVRLQFAADDGIRVVQASNPGAKINDDGTVLLMYEDRQQRGNWIQTSGEDTDWLVFEGPERVKELGDFRAMRLPDGTFRSYGMDATKGVQGGDLTSRSSVDGVTFTADKGLRYSVQAGDKGSMGVFDFFLDSAGGVVMTYVGDLYGANNLRRAYSTDNGVTFTFEQTDILGDVKAQARGQRGTNVDQKVYPLPDGRFWMITMRQGSVYSFISEDDGVTWTAEGLLLEPADFADLGIGSLHDPVMVFLPDGRARMYVTGAEKGGATNPDVLQHIVSATTESNW